MRRIWRNDMRHWVAAGGLVAAGLIGIGLALIWNIISPAQPRSAVGPHVAARTSRTAKPAGRHAPALHLGTTTLATVHRTSPEFAAPGMRASGQVPSTWWGVRSVLPVVATKAGWVKVRLAQRPNGSQAWLPASDVSLTKTRYLIVINLATTHLTLYSGTHKVFSAPAGVGTATDPTPTGHYFVAFSEPPPQPNPGYGPFILVTSAHSQTISNFDGSGDAVIGIHGPLGEDAQIGTKGARISHGCIRLHLAALMKLRHVPPGTPIDIIR